MPWRCVKLWRLDPVRPIVLLSVDHFRWPLRPADTVRGDAIWSNAIGSWNGDAVGFFRCAGAADKGDRHVHYDKVAMVDGQELTTMVDRHELTTMVD